MREKPIDDNNTAEKACDAEDNNASRRNSITKPIVLTDCHILSESLNALELYNFQLLI